MPISPPNLDDHDFDDLVAEARALIPVLDPEWTDHNPSDPGIVLVELLAWLTEMLLFQVNQIPEAHTRKFLDLLGGPPSAGTGLDEAVRRTVRELHEQYRAVTPADYEYLVRETWPGTPEAAGLPAVRRVRCLPGRDLSAADPTAPAAGHVSVVIVPEPDPAGGPAPRPSPALTTALEAFLAPRRILGVRHHVAGPAYADIVVTASLALREDAPPADALDDARGRLEAYFEPLAWPFGRAVHPSKVYAALEQSSLVDYVEDVHVRGNGPEPDDGIELDDHQLARLAGGRLTAYDSYHRTYSLAWGSLA